MTGKPLVLVPVGYRSDALLTEPVRRRFRDNDRVEIVRMPLEPGNYIDNYEKIKELIGSHEPDFAVINADRIEMAGAAAACFNAGLPFAHMYAGILNSIGTTDDVNRHVMTLQSTMQFCESEVAAERVFELRSAVRLPVDQIHTVGITHLDDVTLEPIELLDRPYDLVMYNPAGTNASKARQWAMISHDLGVIIETAGRDDRDVIAIMPAPDRGFPQIAGALQNMKDQGWIVTYGYKRSQFLYLLQHCDRFITNSSTEYYEAPSYLKPEQIIHVGVRNEGRDTGPFQTGASDRIVKIVEDYLCTP